jgi:hypothetical protein
MYSISDIAGPAADYGIAAENLKHFKAGANAAWGREHDLDKAEATYERKHGLEPFGGAARAFSFGWCWSAAH